MLWLLFTASGEGNLGLHQHCSPFVFLVFLVLLPPVSEVTTLKVDQFAWELWHHPNQPQCHFVLEGLRNGFKLGFHHQLLLKSATKNKPSANQHAAVIDDYLAHEVSRGRVPGPFRSPPFPNLHVSSFGVIPKVGQPGKWHLLVDLSSPGGASVNDGIDSHKFTLHYITVNQVIRMVSRLGRGALMAKFDVEAAYRNIPVHPTDPFLLGMKWRDSYYVDLTLPFGLRCGYGRVDPGALLSGFTFTPLTWWFYHSWSVRLDSVCQEPKYSLGCVWPAGLTSWSRQVRRPCPSAYNSRHRIGFCQSGGSPPSREA